MFCKHSIKNKQDFDCLVSLDPPPRPLPALTPGEVGRPPDQGFGLLPPPQTPPCTHPIPPCHPLQEAPGCLPTWTQTLESSRNTLHCPLPVPSARDLMSGGALSLLESCHHGNLHGDTHHHGDCGGMQAVHLPSPFLSSPCPDVLCACHLSQI